MIPQEFLEIKKQCDEYVDKIMPDWSFININISPKLKKQMEELEKKLKPYKNDNSRN